MSKNNPPLTASLIKNFLRPNSLKPNKRLGQNFLINEPSLAQIVEAGELKPSDTIMEVGPGSGLLTLAIAARVKKVIAVEKDPALANALKQLLIQQKIHNVSIIINDILKVEISSAGPPTYKVMANLPYYITNPVIMKFLEASPQPALMVLMVQKEVAQRICAKPPQMNKLAVFCQFYGRPEIISQVPKGHFWPSPKVDSAIIAIKPHTKPLTSSIEPFRQVVRAGFSQPRKQLLNNFSAQLKKPKNIIQKWLLNNKISPQSRAQTLTLTEWARIAHDLINIS